MTRFTSTAFERALGVLFNALLGGENYLLPELKNVPTVADAQQNMTTIRDTPKRLGVKSRLFAEGAMMTGKRSARDYYERTPGVL